MSRESRGEEKGVGSRSEPISAQIYWDSSIVIMPPCFHSVFRYIQPQSSQPLHFMKKIHCKLFILLSLFLSPLLKMQASFSVFLWLFLILSITRQPCKQKSMVEYTHKAWRGGVTGYCRDPASHTHTHTHTHKHAKTHCILSHLLFSITKKKENVDNKL